MNEAGANGGRVLVTREAEAGQGAAARQVVEAYEPVGGPEAVQTPKQVGPQRMRGGEARRSSSGGARAARLLHHG